MEKTIKTLLKEIIDDKNISLIKDNDKKVFDNIIEISNIILKDKTFNKYNEANNILKERISSDGRNFIMNVLSWREENMNSGETYICDFNKFTNPKDFVESYWYIYEHECEGDTWDFNENNFINEFITNYQLNEENEAKILEEENIKHKLLHEEKIAQEQLEKQKEEKRNVKLKSLMKLNKSAITKEAFNGFEETFYETDYDLKWKFFIKSNNTQLEFKIYLYIDSELLNIKKETLIDSFEIELDDIDAFSFEEGLNIKSNKIVERMMNVTSVNWQFPNGTFFNSDFIKIIKELNKLDGDKNNE